MNSNTSEFGQTLVDIKDLRIYYQTTRGDAKAVDGVDLMIGRNEVFGLAGESGCGKSTLARGILGMTKLPGYVKSGEVIFYHRTSKSSVVGDDLVTLSPAEMRRLRWQNIAYIPQSAMNVLSPVNKVDKQILDAIYEHSDMSKEEARARMYECLEMVGLERAVAKMYPHELSGGMKQRVTIAAAVTLRPDLIIADEPTTALDVNVQQVILQELKEIANNLGLTLIYVTHDMAVHAELADRMGIMYSGVMVEVAPVIETFKEPLHPYTQGLISSIPMIGGSRDRMVGIPGRAPSPLAWPSGCRFHPRCPKVMDICPEKVPVMQEVAPGRLVACHLYGDPADRNGGTSEERI
jgi:peptide/nickel transport system ATP-binding protein